MSDPGRGDVWSLVAQEPVEPDDPPLLGGWMRRLCRVAARELSAWGVGVSVMSAEGASTVVAASGRPSEVVEQLQFTLGEGPCHDAFAWRRPVLVSDMTAASRTRWPGYGHAVEGHGVRAVFAFPLQLGAARLGAMDVYRHEIGAMSQHSIARALAFAEAAMVSLLDAQARSDQDPSIVGSTLEGNAQLYQAQGMVQVQLGVSIADAMVRLRAHAFAQDRPLHEVAADVVARRLVFGPES